MADIVDVKRELYEKLKNQKEITGAGIKGSGKSEYIVIFVTELSNKVTSLIPNTFKGIKVKPEKKGMPKSI
jgi:hypothetical protein